MSSSYTLRDSHQPVAENRLVKVTNQSTTPATVTSFTYDGFWRRVRIKSTAGAVGPTLSDARHLWAGSQIAEERDTAGTVTKRFFGNGVRATGGNFFYQRDHLGSIRGVTDANGAVRGAYDFDLWGRRTRLTGDIDADFGFTGHLENGATSLTLTWFRGYDSGMGRWISRDPFQEDDGINLYSYVLNETLGAFDPDGGAAVAIVAFPLIEGIIGTGLAIGLIEQIIDMIKKREDSGDKGSSGDSNDCDPKGGHNKNKRPSNREKHEAGEARRWRDQGHEKKDTDPSSGLPGGRGRGRQRY